MQTEKKKKKKQKNPEINRHGGTILMKRLAK